MNLKRLIHWDNVWIYCLIVSINVLYNVPMIDILGQCISQCIHVIDVIDFVFVAKQRNKHTINDVIMTAPLGNENKINDVIMTVLSSDQ